MVLAASHPHRVYSTSGTDHLHLVYAFPDWAAALVIVAILSLVTAGVWVMACAARGMSRPGRVVVGLVAVYTLVGSVVAFLDTYRPSGDWRGGVVEGSFIVLYGLVGSGIVWAVDTAAKRFRASSPA